MRQNQQGIGMTSLRTRERMIKRLMEQGITHKRVLEVMRNTPRHIFVDEALSWRAYEDNSLPIGYNQTISQPYIVAKMTELLLKTPHRHLKKVLEIGTGCGYQTAVLAQLVDEVYTVERILPLQKQAKSHLWDLKLKNVHYLYSDGGWGWPEYAPYDAILVTASPSEIPEPLIRQLALGGVMVIPVGLMDRQILHRVTHTETEFEVEELEAVCFVPFLSGKE